MFFKSEDINKKIFIHLLFCINSIVYWIFPTIYTNDISWDDLLNIIGYDLFIIVLNVLNISKSISA